ncbi:GTP pyrophosphokinase [Sinomicrobium weinanense]|uniref:RelA/SpoT domain-containing protein n=1 Tax=Sinomicrobium weinanense TaxID=2842200 RepID=A0A926JTA8_9FLAO|nr:RelA/SpoT domain-containing protein [Sinomicrobium weinanense]MBC9796806.1 RelA/SpoT domain-containing protein [Sinomicrobium weinanense]MBU3123690.1 RelA/SpoT domain-containing protein [Sinomicrobium weinanense]
MSIIDNFITQYEKEYDFYRQLARLGHDVLETEIINRGLKAIISNRAKRIDRLKEKVVQRNQKKNYKSKRAIEKDIVDLAGIRVALYFPSDREVVGQVIEELFDIEETKTFPENPHKPKHNKRFSGYWATHYRVRLKKSDEVEKRFTNTVFEIQVASVLMHAWSEVEHDLVYKPFSGNLTEEELSILDEINGLVLTGEIALERLQKAITERTTKQAEITDKYDLTNLIFSNYKNNFKKINFGNTEYLNNYLKAIDKIDTNQIQEAISKINLNINETFSDQLFQNIIALNEKNDNLKKYFSQITTDKKKVSGFELFTKTWIVFEKVIAQLNHENGNKNRKNFIPNLDIVGEVSHLTQKEKNQIHRLRKIRNQMLHGYESFSNEQLEKYYKDLKAIVAKCILAIQDENIRLKLTNELK